MNEPGQSGVAGQGWSELNEEIERLEGVLNPFGLAFLSRVFATSRRVYSDRIEAIGFCNRGRVLDAGCGFGQWSLVLAAVNESVEALEIESDRVEVVRRFAARLGLSNLRASQGSVCSLPYADQTFDAVFSYGVIYLDDWKQSVAEFARVLRPGGRAYVTACDVGWFLHLWKNAPNASPGYDPRQAAADTFVKTVRYDRTRDCAGPGQLIVSSQAMSDELRSHGLSVIAQGGDGTIRLHEDSPRPRAFFRAEYEGHPGCFEMLAEKRRAA